MVAKDSGGGKQGPQKRRERHTGHVEPDAHAALKDKDGVV